MLSNYFSLGSNFLRSSAQFFLNFKDSSFSLKIKMYFLLEKIIALFRSVNNLHHPYGHRYHHEHHYQVIVMVVCHTPKTLVNLHESYQMLRLVEFSSQLFRSLHCITVLSTIIFPLSEQLWAYLMQVWWICLSLS